MSFIGHYKSKTKALGLLVSIWVTTFSIPLLAIPSELAKQAESLQKEPQGDQKALDFLWKNSEKLQRGDLIFLCKLLVKKKAWKEILKASELALAKNPQDAEFLTFQGKSYMEIGKDKKNQEKAQESLRSAIEANPKFEPPYWILDEYYAGLDLVAKANKKPMRFFQTRRLLFEDLIEKVGEKPEFLARLCEINTRDGLNEAALKQCKRALQLDKKDIKTQIYLAQVYKQSGQKAEALTLLESSLKENPRSTDILLALGNQFEEDKNAARAYSSFKECLGYSPENEDCLRGLGATACSLRKFQEGYNTFQKLCKKDRKWSLDVRKAANAAKEIGDLDWQQKFLELSLNCNI
jgi:tetratricopeptide (TPR) repeat protein